MKRSRFSEQQIIQILKEGEYRNKTLFSENKWHLKWGLDTKQTKTLVFIVGLFESKA